MRMRNSQTSVALTLETAIVGRLAVLLLVLPVLLAACSSSDPTEVVKEWEHSRNLFEHQCEAVFDAAEDLRSDDEALHVVRSGDGTDRQRQVVQSTEDCVDSYQDLLAFLEDHEDALVAEWGSDRYTSTLRVWDSAEKEIQKVSQDLGPYSTKTQELAVEERLRERAERERKREQARAQQAQERVACPHHLRYEPKPHLPNARAWAVGALGDDGSLRIWVAAAKQPTSFDACLKIDETTKVVREPKSDAWYRSGSVSVDDTGGRLTARGRLRSDGSLQLELVSNHNFVLEPTIGTVAEPRAGVVYRATRSGQELTNCFSHLRYRNSNQGRAWALAKLRADDSLEIWVAVGAGSSSHYQRCLNLDETVRVATNPRPGQWYTGAAYVLPIGHSLEVQAMLDAGGKLHLRLLRSNKPYEVPKTGVVSEPRSGVTYRHPSEGQRIVVR